MMKKMTAMLFSMAVGLNAVSMTAMADAPKEQETDVLLIGGGIMSGTLGTYLQELQRWRGKRELERLEQRRYGPLGTHGTELYTAEKGRFH